MDLITQRLMMGAAAEGQTYWMLILGATSSSSDHTNLTALAATSGEVLYVGGYSENTGSSTQKTIYISVDLDGNVNAQRRCTGTEKVEGMCVDAQDRLVLSWKNGASRYLVKRNSTDTGNTFATTLTSSSPYQYNAKLAVDFEGKTICGHSGGVYRVDDSGTVVDSYSESPSDSNGGSGFAVAVDESSVNFLHSSSRSTGIATINTLPFAGGIAGWSVSISPAYAQLHFTDIIRVGSYIYGIARSAIGKSIVFRRYLSSISWQLAYTEELSKVVVDAKGNLICAGRSSIICIAPGGTLLWARRLIHSESSRSIWVRDIAIDSKGGLCVAAYIEKTSAWVAGLLLRVPSDGSKTGVYGSITYEEFTPATDTATLSVYSQTMSVASLSPTPSALTFAPTAISLPVLIESMN